MDKKELWQHYQELDRKFEANKAKRAIKTILAFAVAFFAVLCMLHKPTKLLEILAYIFVSIIWAGIHFLINATIFSQLSNLSKAENNILDGIRKRLNE